ncbi:MAG: hypothetical protein WCP65_07130, partial [Bacteroidota bacterium]
MKKIVTSKYFVLLYILTIIFKFNVNASTYYSIANGNWTSSSSWSLTSGGSAISTGYPGVGDDVIIEGGFEIIITNRDALFANNITLGSATNGTLKYDGSGPATLTIASDLTIGGTLGEGALDYAWNGLTITCNKLLKGNGSAKRSNANKQDFIFTGTFTLPASFNSFRNFFINGGNVTLSADISTSGTSSPYIYAGSILNLSTYNMNSGESGKLYIYGTLIVGGPNNFPTGWTTLTIDPNSTVKYNYNGNKLIYPTTYGNLVIEGNGSYQSNRFIESVTITNKGSNYSFDLGKRLTFSGGGGSGASAYISSEYENPYGVRSVTLDNKGSGYTSTPTVTLTGTKGSGATFVANLSTATYSASTSIILPSSLNVSLPIAALTSCSGSSSTQTTFGVSGSGLTASVTISAPSGFEISTSSGGTYSPSLTLTNTSTVSQTLHVRLSAAASVGTISGSITATSSSTTATTIVSGTVNAIPSVNINVIDASGVNPNDAIICAGSSVTLTASGTTADYLWSTSTSSATITPSPLTTTTYTVTGTTSGCSNTASITITVNAIPFVNITVIDASGITNNDGIICAGSSVTLTASGTTADYLWSTSTSSATITPSPLTTTTYTVTGTTSGCSNTASITITVNAIPSISITETDVSGSANNDAVICNGASATLIVSGGSTYLWSTGSTSTSITASPTTITTYTVTGTTTAGCSNITSVTVTVNDLPTVGITETDVSGSANNDYKVCKGGSASLTASGGNTYLWSTTATST